ncbi:MAG: hypothetical protein ACLU48_09255 [Clostridiaceae bacterium]
MDTVLEEAFFPGSKNRKWRRLCNAGKVNFSKAVSVFETVLAWPFQWSDLLKRCMKNRKVSGGRDIAPSQFVSAAACPHSGQRQMSNFQTAFNSSAMDIPA